MKKNDLHDLIQSLTKSEKRYFKLQSRLQGNYLRVFEILEKQPKFDEADLQKQVEGAVFAKQLHVTKHYLREKILESLRGFHAQMSKDAAVKDLLKNVEILFYKELYAQAGDELLRAEVLSKEFELHTAQIEVSRWKRKLEQTLYPNRYERFAEILEEQKKAAKALQNNLDYWEAIVQMAQNFMQRGVPVLNAGLLDNQGQALSLESKSLFFNILYVQCLREGRYSEAEQALVDLIDIFENQAPRVKEDPVAYITTVNNLASFHVFRGEVEKSLQIISAHRRHLEQLGLPDSRRPVLKQVIRTASIELEIFRNAGNPQLHADFFQEAAVFVRKLSPKMPAEYLLSFQFQIAWVSFLKKDYQNALSWVSEPLNAWRKNARYPVFRYLLLLNLMVHCETRNFFVLRYFSESAKRLFRKMGPLHPFEQELFHFFSKIGDSPIATHKGLYLQLKDRLFPKTGIALVPDEAMRMIDFRRWLG